MLQSKMNLLGLNIWLPTRCREALVLDSNETLWSKYKRVLRTTYRYVVRKYHSSLHLTVGAYNRLGSRERERELSMDVNRRLV